VEADAGEQIMFQVTLMRIERGRLKKVDIAWEQEDDPGSQFVNGLRTLCPASEAKAGLERLKGAGGKVLAEPTLITTAGHKANITIGGQVPVPVLESDKDGRDTLSVNFRTFGTELTVTPAILADDRLLLDLILEVSMLLNPGPERSESRLPIISARKLYVTTKMNSGQALLIAAPDSLSGGEKKSSGPMLVLCIAPEVMRAAPPASTRAAAPAGTELDGLRKEVNELRGEVARLAKLLEPRAAGANAVRSSRRSVLQAAAAEPLDPPAPASEPPFTKFYSVADLVLPVRDIKVRRESDAGMKRLRASELFPAGLPAEVADKPDFSPLVKLITARIAPTSWKQNGGAGVIEPLEKNLSLVVQQTKEAHEQIAELLQDLRRLQDRTLQLEIEVISATTEDLESSRADFPAEGRTLSAHQMKVIRGALKEDRKANIVAAPRVSLMNQQVCELETRLSADRELRLTLCGAIADDGDSVRLNLAVNARDAADAVRNGVSAALKAGQTLALDITDQIGPGRDQGIPLLDKVPHVARLFTKVGPPPGERTLLLVTPRVRIEPEVEQPD
jgi:hypothetical protein